MVKFGANLKRYELFLDLLKISKGFLLILIFSEISRN
jgi:hypothetical protein